MKIEKDGNFSTIISSKILFFLEFPCTQPAFSCSNQLKHHKMCEICSKLKLKTRKRRQWRHFGVFIDKFKQILHIVLMFPLFRQVKQVKQVDILLNFSLLTKTPNIT